MNKQSPYYKQVSLLIRLIPVIEKEGCFVKGWYCNKVICALSVDIDVAYIPLEPRDVALH